MPIVNRLARNIVVLCDGSVGLTLDSVTQNDITVTLRKGIEHGEGFVILRVGRVPSVGVIVLLDSVQGHLDTVTLERLLSAGTVDLHHAPLDALDHVGRELHARIGQVGLLALVQSEERLGDQIVPIIVGRDMGLLRVQVGVLVGGGDEVADAVAHVTHDSLLSTTRQPFLERNLCPKCLGDKDLGRGGLPPAKMAGPNPLRGQDLEPDSGSREDTLGSVPQVEVDATQRVDVGEFPSLTLLALTLETPTDGVLLHTVEDRPQVGPDVLLTARVEKLPRVDLGGSTPASNLARLGHLELLLSVEVQVRHAVDVVRDVGDKVGHGLDRIGHAVHGQVHVALREAAQIEGLDDQTIRADQSKQASGQLERGRAIAGVGDEDLRKDILRRVARVRDAKAKILALEPEGVLLVVRRTLVALGLERTGDTPSKRVELLDDAGGRDEAVTIRHAVAGLGGEDGRSELRDLAVVHEGNHACIIACDT